MILHITFALLLTAPPQAETAAPKHLYIVRIENRAEQARLVREASDPDDHAQLEDGRARIYATEAEAARLAASGFTLELEQRDLARFYAARATAQQSSIGVGASMGGFRTLAEIGAELDRLTATYPAIVSPKFSLGASVEGRPIWAIRISDMPAVDDPTEPVAWFDALHHAREPMGGEALLLFADWICTHYPADPVVRRLVETRNLIFVPCVNPDGYEYNRQTNPGGGGLWRKNRRANGDGTFGVDLNRNYGWEWGPQWNGSSGVTGDETYRGTAPFSEPETVAIRDAQTAHPPGMAISAHTFGNLWLYPWGYSNVLTSDDPEFQFYGQQMSPGGDWEFGPPPQILYDANGASLDWSYGALGAFAFSPEIGGDLDGFWPAPSQIPSLFDAVRPGFTDVAKWSGGWAEVSGIDWNEVDGDGDASREPGETWDLAVALANRGVEPAAGALALSSSTSAITVLQGHVAFSVGAQVFATTAAPGGAHAQATFQPVPLRIRIAPNAPSALYTLDLALIYGGVSTIEGLPVEVGTTRVLAFDGMEIAAFGWQSSNSTNWSWARAVPQATTQDGATVQPGNDDPATAGTQCWVTGAPAGSSAGTNDVDGTTVLTSPIFRASGFGHLQLSYARWFANLPGGPLDDQMRVEVSNNGGASWVLLEATSNANAWTTKGFALESYVTLTDALRLRVTVADEPNDDITEGCFDSLFLRTLSSLPTLGLWGATNAGAVTRLFVDGPPSVSWKIVRSTQVGTGTTTSGTAGVFYLTGSTTDVASGTTSAAGRAEVPWTVPPGTVIYMQVLLDEGGAQAAWSNLLTLTVL